MAGIGERRRAVSRISALLSIAAVLLLAELSARVFVPAPVPDPELRSLQHGWAATKGSGLLIVGASDALADINPALVSDPKGPPAFNAAVMGMPVDLVTIWLQLLTRQHNPSRVVFATSPLAALDSDAAEMAQSGVAELSAAVDSLAGSGSARWSPQSWSALWRSRDALARPSTAYRSLPQRTQNAVVQRGPRGESDAFSAVGDRAQIHRNVEAEVAILRDRNVSARWISELRALVASARATGATVSVVLLPTMAGSQRSLQPQRAAAVKAISASLNGGAQVIDRSGLDLTESLYHDGTHLATAGAEQLSNDLRNQLSD